MANDFGKRLQKIRTGLGLTRKELADRMYVSPPTVSRWESGDRLPDVDMIAHLAECLGVEPGELLGWGEEAGEASPPVIMAVDDEPILLAGCVRVLRQTVPEAKIEGFSRSADAVKFARENRPQIAFLDIELRGESGLELAEKLQQIDPSVNIIFLTSHAEYMEDAWKLYASGFILKPLDPERVRGEFSHLRHPVKGLKP